MRDLGDLSADDSSASNDLEGYPLCLYRGNVNVEFARTSNIHCIFIHCVLLQRASQASLSAARMSRRS